MGPTIPDRGVFLHLFLERVIAKIGEHLRGIVEPHERIAVFWGAALMTKHMGNDAESVELQRGA